MWSKIFVLTQVILVAHSITVPPVWPKQNADVLQTGNVRLPGQRAQPKSFTIENFYTHLYTSPITHRNHETPKLQYRSPNQNNETPNLQYRSPNNQQVYIYHPQPTAETNKNIQLNHKPSSYQIVNYDSQEKDLIVHAEPMSNVQELKTSKEMSSAKKAALVKKNDSVERTEEHGDVISEHEFPREVPTKPIYPGEGKWSDYRQRHTPYIANEKADASQPREVEDAQRPEGYDTFVQGQEQFQQAHNKFRHDLDRFPKNHNFKPSPNDDDTESEPLYEKPEIEFVPQKLYAQVRRTESEQHLPKSAIDAEEEENAARLREVIKDSKIHTVYTEEGYEDSAYDHAGHEKHAENSEGHAQLAEDEQAKSPNGRKGGARSKHARSGRNGRGRNSESRKVRNKEQDTDERYDELVKYRKSAKMAQDTESAGSDTESKRVEAKFDELPIKNMQKVTLQTGDKESIDMEIHTEVKYVPGAPQKKHKFIKIIPSYKKHTVQNKTEGSRQKSLRRVKRYDRDDLSKRYVRKRPNYYWKKVKTSTTERPLLNMRRKFQAALKNHNSRTTSTEKPLNANSTPESTVPASTISGTTVTTTSTTPIPPATPSIEEDILETDKTTAKSSKANPLKVKLKKFVVKRQKRFTIDHPNVDVDLKEFIDVKVLPSPTLKPDMTFVKYPYYKSPVTDTMNEYSPLRYAEDMANIPRKTDDLSFYESRSHIRCPQIESNVDPIPDRIKKQENEEESVEADEEEKGESRLSGLGDKIDCLKVKYFGENPLDSPLFHEDVIDEPIPLLTMMNNVKKDQQYKVKVPSDMDLVQHIYHKPRKYDMNAGINEKITLNDKNFAKLSPEKHHDIKNDLSTKQATLDQAPAVLNRTRKRELRVKILKPIIVLDDEVFGTTTLNPIHRKSSAVLRPPYTLLEMMNRNAKKIKPKNIYDQITILEQENDKSAVMSDKVVPLREKFLVIYDQEDDVTTEHALEKQIKMIQPAINGYRSPKVSDIISDLTLYSRHIEQPDVVNLLAETSTRTKPTVSSETRVQSNDDVMQKTLAPKLRVKKPTQNSRKISNRKLQRTTLKPDITPSRPSQMLKESSLPKSEQLQPTQAAMIGLTTESSVAIKHPYVQMTRRSSLPYIFDISRYLPQVPNHRIITSEVHYKDEIKPSEQMKMYSDVLKTINDEISSVQPNVTFAKTTEQESAGSNVHDDRAIQNKPRNVQQFSSTKSIIHNDHIPEASDKIVDLVPPSNGSPYRTVFENPEEPTFELQNAQSINYHYVLGLKPPPEKNTFKLYRKIIKRQITSNAQSLKEVNHQRVNEKIHNSAPFVQMGNGRLKRDTGGKDLDDLIAEESRTYEVTPSRKPKVYTEIVRAKSAIVEKEEDEDSEDLNPRKRVYKLKSSNSVSTENTINFEELIEDEIETQTEPPTTTTTTTPEPIIYPVEANSENPNIAQYVFLVDRLHEKWERENPSTESIPETTSQVSALKPTEVIQTVAESINVPAGEPAFLQIINQLHNIREDEAKKHPPSTTTTAASVIVEEDTPVDPVKNSNPYLLDSISPESFMSELSSMQATLDPDRSNDNKDGSARVRNFSAKFKTSIDTSKYKTIDRNSVSFRHNLSSRYNADDQELPLSRVHTTQLPMISTITTSSQSDITTTRYPIEEVTIGHETTTTKADTEITTARTRKPLRSRNRSTTTPKPTSVTSFRRRRPTRITTTEATTTTKSADILHSRRRSRFRPESQNRSPASKPVYTSTTPAPIAEVAVTTETPEDNKKQRRLQTIHERRVVSEVTLTRFFEPTSDESGGSASNENVEESKRHQYQIAGPLSSATELYSDPELAKHVNQLKDGQQLSTSTAGTPELSGLNSEESVGTTSTNGVVNLYPNMARMINRLAESQSDSMASLNVDTSSEEEDVESGSSAEDKPVFIKDPSKRMYYYARL